MNIEGYRVIDVNKLKNLIRQYKEESGLTLWCIADAIKIRGLSTVQRCMNTPSKVSDINLTNFFSAIGMDCIILVKKGVKYYYIRK